MNFNARLKRRTHPPTTRDLSPRLGYFSFQNGGLSHLPAQARYLSLSDWASMHSYYTKLTPHFTEVCMSHFVIIGITMRHVIDYDVFMTLFDGNRV